MKYEEEQKKIWKEQAEQKMLQMQKMISDLAQGYQEHPEDLAELLAFSSRFYNYSLRNNLLIYAQNPNASYVQSFQAWKKMGYAPKKGEHGLKIYVPVQATILKTEGRLIPLEQATAEQKAQYQAGEIESTTQTHFKAGTVFDIAQTTYPKEKYPNLFHMGYPSTLHKEVAAGLMEFATETLGYQVADTDLKSITLRGVHQGNTHEILLNDRMEDTQRLSTLAHELGHAMLHQERMGKSTAQVELEADALGIMTESYFGIEPTEIRKRHLAQNFRKYQEEYRMHSDMETFGDVLNQVYQEFRKWEPEISRYVEKYVPMSRLHQTLSKRAKPDLLSRSEIYDEIKREVKILDYAQMHGMEIRRVGRYYTLADYDSVRIDTGKNCFWRNSGIGTNTSGSVIDFAMAFVHSGDAHAALTELQGMIHTNRYPVRERKNPLKHELQTPLPKLKENLPKHGKNMRRAYAYLIKSRYIDQDIVQDFVERKMLYQDERGNCVFVSYDRQGEPEFATIRGTLTEKRFLGDIPGSDYSRDFYIENGADRMVVAESVIDAMSIMSILKGQGENEKAYDYLVLTGTQKSEALLTHLRERPMKEVLVSLDHDVSGVTGMQKIQEMTEKQYPDVKVTFHVPDIERNDWNGVLSHAAKKFQPMSAISYLEESELPSVKYCAVQSSRQMEERGFRTRNGKEQYRLVEKKDGMIQPMDIQRNTIFTSPEQLKPLVPPMYVMVEYAALEEPETVQEKQEMHQETAQENSVEEQGETAEDMLAVKGVREKQGIWMADVELDGREQELEVWKREGRFYVQTGYVYDGSQEEYLLDVEEGTFPEWEINEAPDGLLMQQSLYEEYNAGQTKDTSLMTQIQQTEMLKDVVQPSVQPYTPARGIELEL